MSQNPPVFQAADGVRRRTLASRPTRQTSEPFFGTRTTDPSTRELCQTTCLGEVQRLEPRYNDGPPFPERARRKLRTGRPIQ
jgi:hypothetical protein